MGMYGGIIGGAALGIASAYGQSERNSYDMPRRSLEQGILNELAREAKSWTTGSMMELQQKNRPSILARLRGEYPDAPFFERGRSAKRDYDTYAPLRDELLGIAKNPRDDELTQFYQNKYMADVGNRLGARGLIGQGGGESLQTQALMEFLMGARATADARRSAATQEASSLDAWLANRDMTRVGAQRQAEDDFLREVTNELSVGMQAGPIIQAAANLGQQNEMARFISKTTQPTWLEAGTRGALEGFSMGSGMGGMMGGGGGGGATGGTSVPYNFGGQQSYAMGTQYPYSFGGQNYMAPMGGTQMAPWGAPVSNYSLYGGNAPETPFGRTGRYSLMTG